MDLLETVLHRVPGHTVALERLLDLYLGAGNDRRTAELAAELEQLHRERGDTAAADRFSELRRRFGRAAAVVPPEAAAPARAVASTPEFSIPVVDAQPVPEPVRNAKAEASAEDLAASSVHEVDLSEEWAALAGQVETAAFPGGSQDEIALAEASRAAELAASESIGASKKAEEAREPSPSMCSNSTRPRAKRCAGRRGRRRGRNKFHPERALGRVQRRRALAGGLTTGAGHRHRKRPSPRRRTGTGTPKRRSPRSRPAR